MPDDSQRRPDSLYASSNPQSLAEAEAFPRPLGASPAMNRPPFGILSREQESEIERAIRSVPSPADHHRIERRARLHMHEQSTLSDEGLIARLLFHLTTSHASSVQRAIRRGRFDASDSEPSRDCFEAVSDLRERTRLLRDALSNPVADAHAAKSEFTPRDVAELMLALELAWGVIANVSAGDWTQQSPEWQAAAGHWRDTHFIAKPSSCVPTRTDALSARTSAQWKGVEHATHEPVPMHNAD